MAVPHVAGAAAIYLGQNPDASPAQVSHVITSSSTTGLLSTDDMLPGTPNRLLFVDPDIPLTVWRTKEQPILRG